MAAEIAQPYPSAEVASDTLVDVRNLKVHFPIRGGLLGRTVASVKAVDGVDLTIKRGETLGLVGESGCGKSTLGRAVLQLVKPTDGSVIFEGTDLTRTSYGTLRRMRADMQMIFQDPFSSLDPRFTVGRIISEPMVNFGRGTSQEREARVKELLQVVGLNPAWVHRYPHEFSGGQRQRIGIARALALNPKFIVADEPISALDVSIQAQVLNLLADLRDQFNLTYLFIAHNLSAVKHVSKRVAVMYLGHIVELGSGDDVYANPQHPYTIALLSASPIPDPELELTRKRIILTGDVPSPVNPPSGCPFHPRCWKAQAICREVAPPLEEKRPNQIAACHFPGA
ncbi:MAG: oligopeptide ABC transporter, ATP-binding protein OppF [Ktedonobacterales bacterium]|jgi:oligopeptide transport system ATP-binding protein|nr:MAG: oligopeptide ABC transporter, ATP-binding protein OppF [Ktedonobacterales bacterium]